MQSSNILITILVWAVPVLFAITLHEAAHGWVANMLGDPTAKMLGRISANPIKHIDPVGTVILPISLLVLTGFVIGWAKPVPVDARHFKKPILDMAVVAAAGPISNFIMACIWALFMLISQMLFSGSIESFLIAMGKAGILINLILMALNLLPIPPLDGGRVIAGVMPKEMAVNFLKIEPLGMIIVIALLFMGALGKILWPIITNFQTLIYSVFQL